MNFSEKNHKLVNNNEKGVKKSQKHDANLQKNTTLYFQVGLILTLLATYGLFEMQFEIPKVEVHDGYTVDDAAFLMDVVPFVEEVPKQEQKKVQPPKQRTVITSVVKVTEGATKKETANVVTQLTGPKTETTITKPQITVPVNKDYNELTVDQVPVYPGCESLTTNEERRQCMSDKINKLIKRKYDVDIMGELGMSGRQRVYVQFTVDKLGNVSSIKAKGSHEKLEKEAVDVIEKIPQMTPGKVGSQNVNVVYSIPIILQVQY